MSTLTAKLSKSCQPCQRRKKRCDGQTPCSRCVRLGEGDSCSYALERKRGPQKKRRYADDSDGEEQDGDSSSLPSPVSFMPSNYTAATGGVPNLHMQNPLFNPALFDFTNSASGLTVNPNSIPQTSLSTEFQAVSDYHLLGADINEIQSQNAGDISSSTLPPEFMFYTHSGNAGPPSGPNFITQNTLSSLNPLIPQGHLSPNYPVSTFVPHVSGGNGVMQSYLPSTTTSAPPILSLPLSLPYNNNSNQSRRPVHDAQSTQRAMAPPTPVDVHSHNPDIEQIPLVNAPAKTNKALSILSDQELYANINVTPEALTQYVEWYHEQWYQMIPVIDKPTFYKLYAEKRIPDFFFYSLVALGSLYESVVNGGKQVTPTCHWLTIKAEELVLPFVSGAKSPTTTDSPTEDSSSRDIFAAMALSLLSMQYWMRAEHSQSWLFHQMSFHLFCKIWSYRQAMAALSKLSMNSASSSSLSGGSKEKEVTADSNSSSSIKTEQSALGAELEEELLSRLFWALFTTDRTGSIMENKAPLVVIDNVKPFPRYPNFENDIPTSSPILLAHFHPKILLRSYVRVTTLLSRMSIWMRDATSTSQEEETSEEVLSDLGLNMPQSLRDTRLSLLCEFRNFAETFKPPQRFVMDSEASLDYLPMFDKSLVNNFWISTNWIFLILQCYLESDLKARWCAVKIMTMMTSHSTKIPFSTYIIRIAIGAALSFVRSGKYRKKLNVGAVSSTMISPISPDFQNSSFINSHSSASTPYSVPSSYSTSGTTSNSSSAQNSSNCNDIPDLETVIGWFKEAMKHFQTGMWVIQDDIDAIQDQLNQLQQIWYDDLQSVGTDMNAGVKVGLHTQVNGHGHGYYGGTGG